MILWRTTPCLLPFQIKIQSLPYPRKTESASASLWLGIIMCSCLLATQCWLWQSTEMLPLISMGRGLCPCLLKRPISSMPLFLKGEQFANNCFSPERLCLKLRLGSRTTGKNVSARCKFCINLRWVHGCLFYLICDVFWEEARCDSACLKHAFCCPFPRLHPIHLLGQRRLRTKVEAFQAKGGGDRSQMRTQLDRQPSP